MSLDQKLSELLSQPLDRCREALKRCNNNEEEATDYLLTNEDKPEEFWEPEREVLEFERWGDKFEIVDENTLSEIIVKCVETGTLFIDSSFPPEDKSLFFDPQTARSVWKCHDCNKENPRPSEAVVQSYRNRNPSTEQVRAFFEYIAATNPMLAIQMQQNPGLATQLLVQSFGNQAQIPGSDELVCRFCQGKFPLRLIDSEPTQWLRPNSVRDDITIQYGAGSPWKIIRDSVRPDDVRQGAVGNCWFVGALTILARQKPHLVHRLIPFEQEYNEYGAYLIRLCKDGVWRNVIVDDHLPCTRNKTLCYTTASRRQLWVPLIEKAAAKLCGGYEGMHAGTLCEAFSLLTGYATERELLHVEINSEDAELLWARVVSAHAEGFLIGLACAPKPVSKESSTGTNGAKPLSANDLHDRGLQAPHAYILLDTRELVGSGDRLVLLGNPWGDRSPSSWKGAWGNSSTEFRNAVAAGKLPSPSNELNSNGEFWMSWSDLITHFATIEICRTADSELLHDERMKGWLPAATGLGDIFELHTGHSVNGKIRIDLSLYQESNIVRESARGAFSTNVDLGFVVLKGDQKAVAFSERHLVPEVSQEVFLDPCSKYSVVPLSFSNCGVVEHRKVCVAIRSTSSDHVKSTRRTACTAPILRTAIQEYMRLMESEAKPILPGILYRVTKDHCGAIISCENNTKCLGVEISMDAEDSVGLISSRGLLMSTDVIPPGRKMIVSVLTPKRGASRYGLGISFGALPREATEPEMHVPAIHGDDTLPPLLDIHALIPVSRHELLSVQDLINANKDAKYVQLLMTVAMRHNQNVMRLQQDYVAAGISPTEAYQIANEETDGMHLP